MCIFLSTTPPTHSQENQKQYMDIDDVLYMTQNVLKGKQSKEKNDSKTEIQF